MLAADGHEHAQRKAERAKQRAEVMARASPGKSARADGEALRQCPCPWTRRGQNPGRSAASGAGETAAPSPSTGKN
jgi:hypothetical protein